MEIIFLNNIFFLTEGKKSLKPQKANKRMQIKEGGERDTCYNEIQSQEIKVLKLPGGKNQVT